MITVKIYYKKNNWIARLIDSQGYLTHFLGHKKFKTLLSSISGYMQKTNQKTYLIKKE